MRNTGQRKSMNQTGLRDANMNVIEGNKSLNFYYLPSSDKEKRLKINKAKKKLSLTTSDKSQAPPGVDLRDLKARLMPSFVTPVSTHRVASVGFSVRTWSNANTEANKQNIQSPCLKTKAAPRNKRGA